MASIDPLEVLVLDPAATPSRASSMSRPRRVSSTARRNSTPIGGSISSATLSIAWSRPKPERSEPAISSSASLSWSANLALRRLASNRGTRGAEDRDERTPRARPTMPMQQVQHESAAPMTTPSTAATNSPARMMMPARSRAASMTPPCSERSTARVGEAGWPCRAPRRRCARRCRRRGRRTRSLRSDRRCRGARSPTGPTA